MEKERIVKEFINSIPLFSQINAEKVFSENGIEIKHVIDGVSINYTYPKGRLFAIVHNKKQYNEVINQLKRIMLK